MPIGLVEPMMRQPSSNNIRRAIDMFGRISTGEIDEAGNVIWREPTEDELREIKERHLTFVPIALRNECEKPAKDAAIQLII